MDWTSQWLTLLTLAQNRLNAPHRWTQGTDVRDESGNVLSVNHPQAFCFCLWGALAHDLPPEVVPSRLSLAKWLRMFIDSDIAPDAWAELDEMESVRFLAWWNDKGERTQDEVVGMLGAAIKAIQEGRVLWTPLAV